MIAMLFALPVDLYQHRSATARRVLIGMLAAGAVPDPGAITNTTYTGTMFGVRVEAEMFQLEAFQWADVAMSGGPFGSRVVAGRAWYEGEHPLTRHVCMSRVLERTLRRYRVKLVGVDYAAEDGSEIELRLELPVFGTQRMTLTEVPASVLALRQHRDLLW